MSGTVPPAAEDRGGLRVAPGRRDVADLELERLEATELTADEPGDDIESIALVDDLGQVRPPERDAVEHVEVAAQGQLAVATAGGPDPGDGQAEDGDERLRVPGTARRETGQLAEQRVVDAEGRQREVDPQRGPRVARGRLRGDGQEALAERRPAVGRQLEAGGAGMATEPR